MTDQCELLKSQASQAFEGALSSQLSVESLYVLLQSLQHNDTVPGDDRWARADQLIGEINADGSGNLTYLEYVQLITLLSGYHLENELQDAFLILANKDTNKIGLQ